MLPDPLLRQVRRLTLKAKRSAHELLAGHYESAVRGSGLTFSDVRAYEPGDDVRRFDWNVTARTGTPHVKRFVEERERVVYLVVDVSASQFFGGRNVNPPLPTLSHQTEYRDPLSLPFPTRGEGKTKRQVVSEVAALLAFAASIQKDRVGLVQFTDRIEQMLPPQKGDRHARRVVHELFSFEPRGKQTSLATALMPLQRRRRAVVVLFSDFRDSNWERLLKVTSRRHDLICVLVSDPAEFELPKVGRLRLSDAELGGSLVINTNDLQARTEYSRRSLDRHAQVLKRIKSAGADVLELNTSGNHLSALLRFLRRRSAQR